jgi:hypothetical protein
VKLAKKRYKTLEPDLGLEQEIHPPEQEIFDIEVDPGVGVRLGDGKVRIVAHPVLIVDVSILRVDHILVPVAGVLAEEELEDGTVLTS